MRSTRVRRAPGDRRRRPARLGDPPRRGDRDAARRRGLRLLRRRAARGARLGAVPAGRRSGVSPAGSRSGVERTIDQDPAFALRILVDVAIRALSPAVNDPTTAVQVIDHLEDTLGADRPDARARRALGVPRRREQPPTRDARAPVRGPALARRHRDPGVRAVVDPGRAAAAGCAARARGVRAARVRAGRLGRARATARHGDLRRSAARRTPSTQLRADRQGIGGPPRLDEPARRCDCGSDARSLRGWPQPSHSSRRSASRSRPRCSRRGR